MIELRPVDCIPLEQFPLAVRFTDPRCTALPADVMADLRPLSPVRAAALSPALRDACASNHFGTAQPKLRIDAACWATRRGPQCS